MAEHPLNTLAILTVLISAFLLIGYLVAFLSKRKKDDGDGEDKETATVEA